MLIVLMMIVIWVVAVVGWILNVVKIVKTLNVKEETPKPVTPLFIARCIGVIAAPLGAILGYMKI
ncbi:hypothetical protein GALL_327830 [mine drainage metagenome]|uniref:Uncharacterized protein n=1 Tax=mine drainage metagenome TaxID=410659 RepID=A0A1J5RB66_9ZZZZ